MKRTTVLLADDHQMFLDGLSHFLAREFDVVALTRDGGTLLEMVRQHHPDVLIVDISMPQLSGMEAVRVLRSEAIPAKILFLSMYADLSLVEEAFRIGASGYVLKSGSMDELVKAIQCISRGGTYVTPLLGDVVSTLLTAGPHNSSRTMLTSRQRDVLRLLTEGRTMKQIGEFLHISTRTTESHKYEIMRNLGLKTTAELIRYAVRNKLV